MKQRRFTTMRGAWPVLDSMLELVELWNVIRMDIFHANSDRAASVLRRFRLWYCECRVKNNLLPPRTQKSFRTLVSEDWATPVRIYQMYSVLGLNLALVRVEGSRRS